MEEERLYDLYAIDEDIKECESLIKILDKTSESGKSKHTDCIEHLIEAYRQVKEDYKNIVQVTQNADSISFPVTTEIAKNLIKIADYNLKENYIPKSKIKEKIEELTKNFYDSEFYDDVIEVLQELLEEDE